MSVLDCRGLDCPRPVILTKKELENLESGELEVIVDNDVAKENVSKFAKSLGADFTVAQKDGNYHITIKKEKVSAGGALNASAPIEQKKNIALLISNDKLGEGDPKLGDALMKSYLYALSESSEKPGTMLFINSGVKLTTEGSEVIESLRALEAAGVTMLSCGTCLDFYQLKEKLIISSITNMYTIIEKMNEATNTIKL